MKNQRKKILLLLSREYPRIPTNGRQLIINNTLEYCRLNHFVRTLVVKSVFNDFTILGWLNFWYRCVKSMILNKEKTAFQSIAFCSESNSQLLNSLIANFKPDIIFVDGVRLMPIVRGVSKHHQSILDMDDLLSRRFSEWRKKNLSLSFGFIGQRLQGYADLLPRFAETCFLKMETRRLMRMERDAAVEFNKIIFTSDYERRLFKRLFPQGTAELFSQALYISNQLSDDCSRKRRFPNSRSKFSRELGFVFVGSDRVVQNRLTIDFLIGIWKRHQLEHRITFVGKMSRFYSVQGNIHFLGFVETLDEIFLDSDALICPSFVRGGIKTKVLEAFSHGLPVIGNVTTFEGLCLRRDYPIILDTEELPKFLNSAPREIRATLQHARNRIPEIMRRYSREEFEKKMCRIFSTGDTPNPVPEIARFSNTEDTQW